MMRDVEWRRKGRKRETQLRQSSLKTYLSFSFVASGIFQQGSSNAANEQSSMASMMMVSMEGVGSNSASDHDHTNGHNVDDDDDLPIDKKVVTIHEEAEGESRGGSAPYIDSARDGGISPQDNNDDPNDNDDELPAPEEPPRVFQPYTPDRLHDAATPPDDDDDEDEIEDVEVGLLRFYRLSRLLLSLR